MKVFEWNFSLISSKTSLMSARLSFESGSKVEPNAL